MTYPQRPRAEHYADALRRVQEMCAEPAPHGPEDRLWDIAQVLFEVDVWLDRA